MSKLAVDNLLRSVSVPKDHKWELFHRDNVLFLVVSARQPMELKIFGRIWWSRKNGWEAVREIQAPNYASLLAQLENWPEFLEFYQEGVYHMTTAIDDAVNTVLHKERRPGGLLHP